MTIWIWSLDMQGAQRRHKAFDYLILIEKLVILQQHACMSSLGIEVLEAVPKPDVVVVCCGGGGLLAGVAAAIKLSGCDKTRIYGVEPEGGKCSTATSPRLAEEALAVTRTTAKEILGLL